MKKTTVKLDIGIALMLCALIDKLSDKISIENLSTVQQVALSIAVIIYIFIDGVPIFRIEKE